MAYCKLANSIKALRSKWIPIKHTQVVVVVVGGGISLGVILPSPPKYTSEKLNKIIIANQPGLSCWWSPIRMRCWQPGVRAVKT